MPMFWNNLFVVLSLFRGCYLLLFDHLASQKGEIQMIIIYMKKLLDSDWLRAVQFKCNTSAKSVTPVQKV